jgi:hypothetical protein
VTAISTLRANLIGLIGTLLPGTEILETRMPEAWFAVNIRGGSAVVVSYAGKPKREPGPIGKRDRQGYVYRFTIAITGENWAAPAEATYAAADMAETLFGSPFAPPNTPNLRTETIGSIAGEALYLRFVDEVMQMAPNSTPEGGRFAIVQTWETNEARM